MGTRMPEPAWRHEGIEPDYRFTLANERTFLVITRPQGALPGVATATLLASAGGVASVFVSGGAT